MTPPAALLTFQDALEHIVFGNGWVALVAVGIVSSVAVAVRITGGIRL